MSTTGDSHVLEESNLREVKFVKITCLNSCFLNLTFVIFPEEHVKNSIHVRNGALKGPALGNAIISHKVQCQCLVNSLLFAWLQLPFSSLLSNFT